MRLLNENDVRPLVAQTAFAAPGIRNDLLDDPDCGLPLRAFVALTGRRLGADLSAEDRWLNRYFWFLRFAHLHREKFGYDAGIENQISDVLAEAAQFNIDPAQLDELEAVARLARLPNPTMDWSAMAYIPKDARWYLAEVVLEHTIEDDPRNVVHVNVHLIEAHSPQRAYEKACALGHDAERAYANSDGKEVCVVFRGLRDLNVIHEALEDCAELTYERRESVPEDRLAGWVRPKESLAVFRERKPGFATGEPNLMPEPVMETLEYAGFDRTRL